MGILRRTLPALILVTATACTLPPLATPTASPTASPTRTPSASPTPTDPPTPTPSATPDPAAIPDFTAGEIVGTTIDGLRVRQRPGLTSSVVTGLLPLGAELQVVMGPIPTDGQGWYLVTDADTDEPQFEEGWIAAGYEPEPFLATRGRTADPNPYVASFAGVGDAEFGPIEIGDGDHVIRWIATDPERVRCQFGVLLAAGTAEPVPAIRATIGSDLVPGTLQAPGFDAVGVRGQAFLTVASDCAWALVVVRVPEVAPEPSATP